MNTLLLQPTDVLFFRDGRPMGGASAGHGAGWPLPTVTDAAFHAALHRSDLRGHAHDQIRRGARVEKDVRTFGSLVTAGPFPVREPAPEHPERIWYFPRPLDLLDDTTSPALLPAAGAWTGESSLPEPLRDAVANRLPPSKDCPARAWLSRDLYEAYLRGESRVVAPSDAGAVNDHDFCDTEQTIGIGISRETGTTGQGDAEGKIYSAHYLRLRDEWRLGVLAATAEKPDATGTGGDLIPKLISHDRHVLVGGQQRLCTALRLEASKLPLPIGSQNSFRVSAPPEGGRSVYRVKWVLLTPAIWPEVTTGTSPRGTERRPHPGGWLPSWIDARSGEVLLRVVPSDERRERRKANYGGKGYESSRGGAAPIPAKLVAALISKPIPVTGWALAHASADGRQAGAKSTLMAVPAGAVYYFEVEPDTDGGASNAIALAATLNWHGSGDGSTLRNRRSTLLGEKGFGLGVCAPWQPHPFFST